MNVADKLMLDIESMSTHPGNALVLSIGAVRFMVESDEAPVIGDKKLWVLSIPEQILACREISPDTQRWWSQQDAAARSHWMHGLPVNTSFAMEELAQFAEGVETVWANGIVFDIGNIESLCRAHNMTLPWRYNAPRDARTIYDLPKRRFRTAVEPFVAHDPIADCIEQIWRLWEHWPMSVEGAAA